MGQNRKGKQPVTEQEKQKYQEYVKEMTPTHNLGMQMFNAFICGGIICLIGQIILEYCLNTLGMEKETAAGWCSLMLILLSVVLTALHLYGKIVKWGGAGALVPITGFANSVAATAIEFKAEGWVFGVGSKIFTIAGPVILYGIVSSWVLGLIYWIMKCMGAA
ncbi:MAG: SpoVA/SpoVAEb family sporulation membrane protein [Lachnospiraceae bacterium]